MKAFLIVISIIFLFYFACCSTQLYIPNEEIALKYNVDITELKKGRSLYTSKCSSCHNLYLPTQYTKKEWKNLVHEMKKEANISNAEETLIYNYLTAMH